MNSNKEKNSLQLIHLNINICFLSLVLQRSLISSTKFNGSAYFRQTCLNWTKKFDQKKIILLKLYFFLCPDSLPILYSTFSSSINRQRGREVLYFLILFNGVQNAENCRL
ncbi:hypothetical protein BpHYR1_030472 [Brachionus plicatilis]|uniref:Uncharacterized protein n=1 Tax=Brachionus plicatilis TaxID=10195 RepID=A0A3M7PK14_BRAPC|nr:hypothetical protein BpHYR1_030472 [Brachionus plicatilis]